MTPSLHRAFSMVRFLLGLVASSLFVLTILTLLSPNPLLSPMDPALSAPLGSPAVVPATGTFAFENHAPDGTPVTYDPCRPIEYVVNRDSAPPGGAELFDRALERISAASGLHFVYLDETRELPRLDRSSYDPLLYGERWAPVLVAWTTPEVAPDLAGAVVGRGGSAALTTGDTAVYVSGVIEIDGPEIASMMASGQELAAELVITHELAHLVGLAHVDDPNELMSPILRSDLTDLGTGDRQGLARAGSGTCFEGMDSPALLHSVTEDDHDH